MCVLAQYPRPHQLLLRTLVLLLLPKLFPRLVVCYEHLLVLYMTGFKKASCCTQSWTNSRVPCMYLSPSSSEPDGLERLESRLLHQQACYHYYCNLITQAVRLVQSI